MKKLACLFIMMYVLISNGQNVQVINPTNNIHYNPQPQMAMNTSDINNDAIQINQKKTPQIQIQQQASLPINYIPNEVQQVNKNYNPPQQNSGQNNHYNAGYSGSSGSSSKAKHHSKKALTVKFKKAMKVFEHRYNPPKHYGHKGRITKCHGF